MKLQEQRSTFSTNKCCPLTNRCRKILLPTAAAPVTGIWLLRAQLPLLLLFAGLQRPTVAIKINFDLAPDSFDDQYQGCSQQVMEELNEGDYFTKEVEAPKNYHSAWHNAHLTWLSRATTLPKNMTITHAVAIMVYTLNNNVRSEFSRAMASTARSAWQYKHSFHFKFLHYYLTSAIQLLRKGTLGENDSLCYNVHHEADFSSEAYIGATLRFGQFLSTSLLRKESQKFENQTLFTILTCLGAPVQRFSLKEEVLVPPYELFEVVNMSYYPRGNWLQLRSTGNLSTYNCQLLKASSKKCIPAPVVIAALFWIIVTISSKSGI
ncbi:PREDICTED: ecto-ADP-ribosyltransferase 4 isoform X2 [Miniopterus natalensis]|uniref:ecto-ADP-ribosyltransferase 4 isoform X2 n=1 Tax=Miniopterus natalensis TaxID=291302 RepID=UPI0007A6E458|nr:PREDICTED: ecto-ADP-ribosyltransferase 4 isoform X2 [Miniopterus natalensis]